MASDAATLTASVLRGVESGSMPSVIQRVAARFFKDDFQATVEKFIDNNVGLFMELTEDQIDAGENKLEWHDAYERFIGVFDESLEEYVTAEGCELPEFFELCAKADKAPPNADGSPSAEQDFVRLLTSTSDYESFLRLMKEEADELRDDLKAAGEAKEAE